MTNPSTPNPMASGGRLPNPALEALIEDYLLAKGQLSALSEFEGAYREVALKMVNEARKEWQDMALGLHRTQPPTTPSARTYFKKPPNPESGPCVNCGKNLNEHEQDIIGDPCRFICPTPSVAEMARKAAQELGQLMRNYHKDSYLSEAFLAQNASDLDSVIETVLFRHFTPPQSKVEGE